MSLDILTANDRAGCYPSSYYVATANRANFSNQPIQGQHHCDVCIIGGGLSGLSSALHLSEAGLKVILLEANLIAWGASGRNGGQVGTGQRQDQLFLEKMLGTKHAKRLWDISLESVDLVKDLIKKHKINCAFTAGILHADHKQSFVKGSHAYASKLQNDYGYNKIRAISKEEIAEILDSSNYFGGTLDRGGGHLHPLNFSLSLGSAAQLAGAKLYQNSRVIDVDTKAMSVKTDDAKVSCDFIAFCCNGYLDDRLAKKINLQCKNKIGGRIMPINNFIIATEPLAKERAEKLIKNNIAVADSRYVINYFRLSEDRRLLFGGGENYSYKFPSNIAKKVRKPMLEVFPSLSDVKIDYAWGGTLAITRNRMPFFAEISRNTFSMEGYSGHGVALATLAGKLLSQKINKIRRAGKKNHQENADDLIGFDAMAKVSSARFPGGSILRWPLMVAAMAWYSLKDRI